MALTSHRPQTLYPTTFEFSRAATSTSTFEHDMIILSEPYRNFLFTALDVSRKINGCSRQPFSALLLILFILEHGNIVCTEATGAMLKGVGPTSLLKTVRERSKLKSGDAHSASMPTVHHSTSHITTTQLNNHTPPPREGEAHNRLAFRSPKSDRSSSEERPNPATVFSAHRETGSKLPRASNCIV